MPRKVTVIAEPGCTHEGSLRAMRALINLAAFCGADVYKGQWMSDPAAVCARRNAPDYRRYYDWLAYPVAWHKELAAYCASRGLRYAVTVYLPGDVAAIAPYVSLYKVSSFEAMDGDLLAAYAALEDDKPLVVSCGMGATVRRGLFGKRPVQLLLCVSAYPTRPEDLHLSDIRARGFDGLSDHTPPDCVDTGGLAVAAGATVVERHVRLRGANVTNPDCSVAMRDGAFAQYVRFVRRAEIIMGEPQPVRPRAAEAPMARYRVGGV